MEIPGGLLRAMNYATTGTPIQGAGALFLYKSQRGEDWFVAQTGTVAS